MGHKKRHKYDTQKAATEAPTTEATKQLETCNAKSHCTDCPSHPRRHWGMTTAEWVMAALTALAILVAIFTGDQRAWIGVHRLSEKASIPIVANKDISETIRVNNTGKTAAKWVEVFTFVEVVKNGDSPDLADTSSHSRFAYYAFLGDLFPNDFADIPAVREKKQEGKRISVPLSDKEYRNLTDGSAYIAIYGNAVYGDIFRNKRHHRKFCFWFGYKENTSYTASACTAHNTEDEDKRQCHSQAALTRTARDTMAVVAMPSYWPDNKPHKPAYRHPLNRVFYWLYRHFGLRSRFWVRVWSESEVFRILRIISRQQVHGFVANPEGGKPIWNLDAPEDVQENRYPLNTCLLRGWIEVLDMTGQSYKGFPIAQPLIAKGGSFDDFSRPPYYRMTTAGWNALYRHYATARVALAISLIALAVSATVAVTNWRSKTEPPILRVTFPAPMPPR